jgi:ABC-type multidrug transport system ATPase subunit
MSMDLQRTSGDIRLLGNDIDKVNIVRDGNKMGMCAQSNTIWDVMTVNECIRFVCEVKGIKGYEI